MYLLNMKILQLIRLLPVGSICLNSNSQQRFFCSCIPYYEYNMLQISSLLALFQGQHGHGETTGRQADMIG